MDQVVINPWTVVLNRDEELQVMARELEAVAKYCELRGDRARAEQARLRIGMIETELQQRQKP